MSLTDIFYFWSKVIGHCQLLSPCLQIHYKIPVFLHRMPPLLRKCTTWQGRAKTAESFISRCRATRLPPTTGPTTPWWGNSSRNPAATATKQEDWWKTWGTPQPNEKVGGGRSKKVFRDMKSMTHKTTSRQTAVKQGWAEQSWRGVLC